MKHPDWHNRLIAVIRAAEKRPFLWGEHDCCLFAADCAEAMTGDNFADGWRGTYDSETGAKKALLRGGGSLEKVLAKYLNEVPVKMAQRGDIAVVENAGTRCAGVIYGGAVWAPGETGLVCLRIKPLSTWRVR
ncbi:MULTISPECIES: DUF6950 family protein [unclassified Enterobacter cloacae complex]|uniref:DUF6950 family protein n=1 Tax=unclassified Enterobacter cloacae complex TaxID=2757714 RepID=UPI000B507A25|nr:MULTISPECIES: hypothetical protein [unclassified Enterobacter cloacae complex]HDC4426052.1 hypothetical protein [Enterobacter asburiae]ASD58625.1 hypothetical protein WM95_08735 [Enterobacter cloacae complex sp. ECNIH7]POV37498.1 hypothetical protein C3397_25905 [Enterobacter cloacae complex sp. ECNIH16]POV43901.1 hypothetical protein C3394_03540 [Enterobacter cloacae complex sp. ECNIH11]HDT5660626.1 hypothetical protein [Enterobacter asburiae]